MDNEHLKVYRLIGKFPRGQNRKHIDRLISNLLCAGWPIFQIARYCRCTEEINPKLKEETALARMREIEKQVGIPAYRN